jgi:hypothetical protein
MREERKESCLEAELDGAAALGGSGWVENHQFDYWHLWEDGAPSICQILIHSSRL